MTEAELRQWCKGEGLCPKCKSTLPASCHTVLCAPCQALSRAAYRAWYQRRKKAGGCVYCAKRAEPGVVACASCMTMRALDRKIRRQEERRHA